MPARPECPPAAADGFTRALVRRFSSAGTRTILHDVNRGVAAAKPGGNTIDFQLEVTGKIP